MQGILPGKMKQECRHPSCTRAFKSSIERSLHEFKKHDKSEIKTEPVKDSTGYGDNWYKKRQKIIERDEMCQLCGDDTAREVHHIRKKKLFDDIENANMLDNLILLCGECHRSVEGTPTQRQVLLFGLTSHRLYPDNKIAQK